LKCFTTSFLISSLSVTSFLFSNLFLLWTRTLSMMILLCECSSSLFSICFLFLVISANLSSIFSLISLSFSACASFQAFSFSIFHHSLISLQYCLFQTSGRNSILTSYSAFRCSIRASKIAFSRSSMFCLIALEPFLYILPKTLALLYIRDLVASFLTWLLVFCVFVEGICLLAAACIALAISSHSSSISSSDSFSALYLFFFFLFAAFLI